MNSSNKWFLVDDLPDEAVSFAVGLSSSGVSVDYLSPPDARESILTGKVTPAGVLMDVDLAAQAGELGTGPGIAQDIRVKQKVGAISEFPVVRFAAEPRVKQNIWGDPSSDDLFDLKIQKEEMRDLGRIVNRLLGVREVYDALIELNSGGRSIFEIFGCSESELGGLGHDGLNARLLCAVSPHVSANLFLRSFIIPTGLLIDATVLSYRLGVDHAKSGMAWNTLLNVLPFKYSGTGGRYFERWWARGLEEWWYEKINSRSALVGLTSVQRVEMLFSVLKLDGLVPLELPLGSPGEKPWRTCALGLEKNPPEYVPVDPDNGVRLISGVDLPVWVDPLVVSLKEAIQNAKDNRLQKQDIDRLVRKHR